MSDTVGLRANVVARVGRLLVDVSFETGPGTLIVVGPNGAGKTSLLSLVLGARSVERGRIEVAGNVLLDTEAGVDVPIESRRLGYVPQDYALFPHLTVRENVEFAVESARSTPGQARGRARTAGIDGLLRQLGLEGLADRRPRSLSGGEKQRVALARALSVGPRALLLDEPLAALDVHSRREVRNFLAGNLKHLGLPTVVVTHDAADARLLGDRIAVLEEGRLTQTGTWDELVAHPASQFIESFVSS
jgi:molybdate transport system ATP-binding protein